MVKNVHCLWYTSKTESFGVVLEKYITFLCGFVMAKSQCNNFQ